MPDNLSLPVTTTLCVARRLPPFQRGAEESPKVAAGSARADLPIPPQNSLRVERERKLSHQSTCVYTDTDEAGNTTPLLPPTLRTYILTTTSTLYYNARYSF